MSVPQKRLRAILWCAVSTKAQAADEKASLPAQEADLRAVCQREGWDVVAVLRVPGHSRDYIDFHKLAGDAAHAGIDAFTRLRAHWEACDFDVLVVRDGDRFARTQSLHAFITEMTIYEAGAVIYSLADGMIDETNAPMYTIMAGYKAANDNRERKKKYQMGMNRRAERGLTVSTVVPQTHKLLRDEVTGKPAAVVVNEDRRRFYDDVTTVLLEGVTYQKIEMELFQRYGHVNKKGVQYHRHYCYWMLMNPVTWGHTARHHRPHGKSFHHFFGAWVFDEGLPAPEGVDVWRNTVPPVYTGAQAEDIKAELRRRMTAIKGRATPYNTNPLRGIVVCGECFHSMATLSDRTYRAVYCPYARSQRAVGLPGCNNKAHLHEREVIAWIDKRLRAWVRHHAADFENEAAPAAETASGHVEALRAEIAKLDAQARVLIREQSSAAEAVQPIYRDELEKIGDQLLILRERLATVEYEAAKEQQQEAVSKVTVEQMATIGVDNFWKQESRVVNQMLHKLLGRNKIVVLGHEVVGWVEQDLWQRQRG